MDFTLRDLAFFIAGGASVVGLVFGAIYCAMKGG